MSAETDLEHCREAIKTGSRSFYAASHLLPKQACDDALALYAFCRLADDAVDLHDEKAAAASQQGEDEPKYQGQLGRLWGLLLFGFYIFRHRILVCCRNTAIDREALTDC